MIGFHFSEDGNEGNLVADRAVTVVAYIEGQVGGAMAPPPTQAAYALMLNGAALGPSASSGALGGHPNLVQVGVYDDAPDDPVAPGPKTAWACYVVDLVEGDELNVRFYCDSPYPSAEVRFMVAEANTGTDTDQISWGLASTEWSNGLLAVFSNRPPSAMVENTTAYYNGVATDFVPTYFARGLATPSAPPDVWPFGRTDWSPAAIVAPNDALEPQTAVPLGDTLLESFGSPFQDGAFFANRTGWYLLHARFEIGDTVDADTVRIGIRYAGQPGPSRDIPVSGELDEGVGTILYLQKGQRAQPTVAHNASTTLDVSVLLHAAYTPFYNTDGSNTASVIIPDTVRTLRLWHITDTFDLVDVPIGSTVWKDYGESADNAMFTGFTVGSAEVQQTWATDRPVIADSDEDDFLVTVWGRIVFQNDTVVTGPLVVAMPTKVDGSDFDLAPAGGFSGYGPGLTVHGLINGVPKLGFVDPSSKQIIDAVTGDPWDDGLPWAEGDMVQVTGSFRGHFVAD